jgi:hypothetical protein
MSHMLRDFRVWYQRVDYGIGFSTRHGCDMDRPRFYIPKPLVAADPEGRQAQQAYMANLLDRARAGRDALIKLIERGQTRGEREHRGDFKRHMARHRLVVELLEQQPGTRKWVGKACKAAAASGRLVADKAVVTAGMISDSYQLIQRAGGERATFDSYLAEVRLQTEARRRRTQKS